MIRVSKKGKARGALPEEKPEGCGASKRVEQLTLDVSDSEYKTEKVGDKETGN